MGAGSIRGSIRITQARRLASVIHKEGNHAVLRHQNSVQEYQAISERLEADSHIGAVGVCDWMRV